jgi:hypothetical protein
VGLLHVVLVRCFENALLGLLRVEKAQFDGDVHGVLEFLYSLLHRAEIRSEVGAGLFLHERENNRQLVEKVVYRVQHRVQWQVCVHGQEKLMLHQHRDFNAKFLLAARGV